MLKQDGMKFDHSFIQSIDIVDGHTIAFTLSQPGF